MSRPCSSKVYQEIPTPASCATSSRLSPGVRLLPGVDSPNCSGCRRARRVLKKSASSARLFVSSFIWSLPSSYDGACYFHTYDNSTPGSNHSLALYFSHRKYKREVMFGHRSLYEQFLFVSHSSRAKNEIRTTSLSSNERNNSYVKSLVYYGKFTWLRTQSR